MKVNRWRKRDEIALRINIALATLGCLFFYFLLWAYVFNSGIILGIMERREAFGMLIEDDKPKIRFYKKWNSIRVLEAGVPDELMEKFEDE